MSEVSNNHRECPSSPIEDKQNEEENSKSDDVAKFDGKIVYNPDGSAYIIDGDDDNIPRQEGSIVEKRNSSADNDIDNNVYPQIAKAIYVKKKPIPLQEESSPSGGSPLIHSYRVYSLRGGETGNEGHRESEEDHEETLKKAGLGMAISVPVKPILMCFICKLSFGFAKSFINHCSSDHGLELREDERNILDVKNSSAIIQVVGKEKSPIVSFLEPENKRYGKDTIRRPSGAKENDAHMPDTQQMLSPSAIKGILSAALNNAAAAAAAAAAASSSEKVDSDHPNPSAVEFPPPFGGFLDSLSPSMRNSLLEMNRASNNGRSSISPVTSNSLSCSPSPSLPPLPPGFNVPLTTNANMLQGTTIGACPDHVNGRPTGVECAKCDIILKASHMPGGLAWNAARNSCKTLKCPKCNWHYKYQETLDIHMKEKHPENETTCIYCITGQQHPRLARGETYTCGYKPYRCEVCNYSTTTKGNLSIHMQSDKHLNNMQELQNGGVVPSPDGCNKQIPSSVGGPHNIPGSPMIPKQKPSWRCDVCNYETNVARNLRIHMTSEKHTHNIMVLQQNMKQMQQMSGGGPPPPPLPLMFGAGGPGGMPDPQMFQLQLAAGLPPFNSDSKAQPEAAMADLAYFQALIMQMMTGGQFPPGPVPPDFAGSPGSPMNEEAMEPPPEPPEPNPKHLFSCCVCREFGSDALELLSQHLTLDRTKIREHEVSMVIGGNYICKLCSYKTNLKANFQLHCKTDKHLQRLNHVNHIKEGGPGNEWRLKFLNVTNPVQLRCNACDYYTNSLHKLQLHTANQRHEISTVLFSHLKKSEAGIPEERRTYSCSLCKFESPGKTPLMIHVRSMKHLQMEQIHQLQKKSEGGGPSSNTDIGDIFQVLETIPENESTPDGAPDDKRKAETDDKPLPSSSSAATAASEVPAKTTPCPLCQEPFQEYSSLESHVLQIHSVNAEGLQRLLVLMEGSHWLNNNQNNRSSSSSSVVEEEVPKGTGASDEKSQAEEVEDGNSSEDRSLVKKPSSSPQNSSPSISRKTDKGLNTNNNPLDKYLDPNRPYKCDVCKESFTQKNILLVHYNSVSHLHKLKRTMHEKTNDSNEIPSGPVAATAGTALEAALGNLMNKKDVVEDEAKPYKCNICNVAYTQGSTLDIHIRSVLHQTRASKLQELAITGQIDLSKPLIEQPETLKQSDQEQRKILQDVLMSPKSLNSSGSSNQRSSPNLTGSPSATGGSPQSSPLANLQSALFNQSSSVQKSLNDLFLLQGGTESGLSIQQQQLAKLLQAFPGLASPNNSSSNPDDKSSGFAFPPSAENKKSSHVLKGLLQNYGFELVMQFNEYHQRKRQEEEERRRKREAEEAASAATVLTPKPDEEESLEPVSKMDTTPPSSENIKNNSSSRNPPELKKSQCPICKKEFSSIWVLKAHSEEIHKDAVPPEFLEKFVEEFKSNLEKKDEDPIEKMSPIKDQIPSSFLTPEKSVDEGLSTSANRLPETSTPKSRSSTPATHSAIESEHHRPSSRPSSRGNNSTPGHSGNHSNRGGAPPAGLPPDMQSVLQQAMLSSSSKPGINPMMLQMAQLQGMNPLVAMNLHPPLIPPAMLSNGNNNSLNISSDQAALVSQMQNSLPNILDPQNQMLSQFGLDPKLMMKTGIDPNFLMGLDPKKAIQSAMDPKLLSMLASTNKESGVPSHNTLLNLGLDPKVMGGLPPHQGPDPKLLMQLAQGLDPSKLNPGVIPPPQTSSQGGADPKGSTLIMNQQKQGVFQQPEQQKRARTRITDEQLKILRSNFDINNSPTESATTKMSQQTGLPPKVIKHWFRNTLFKERQRNKDSPYNFNNPPSTILNLEEYEKTGESKVTPLDPDEQRKYSVPLEDKHVLSEEEKDSQKMEDEPRSSPGIIQQPHTPPSASTTPTSGNEMLRLKKEDQLKKESEEGNENIIPSVVATSSSSLTLSSILGSQMNVSHPANFLSSSPFSNFGGGGGGGGSGSGNNSSPLGGGSSGIPDFMNPLSNMMGEKSGSRSRSPSGGSSSQNQGKRANRTRFTDYQIKVLQEFFENNAYPKDDDLEYLSKLLSLSPRVIVVWFQNARQKARKIYENQPPIDPSEDGAGRFTRTPGLNYQCKKCLLVFQRYYELIRHQKQHCFKEEDAKRSAQAQKAAAQAAAQFSGQSPNNFNVNNSTHSEDSNSSGGVAGMDRSFIGSPMFNQSSSLPPPENNRRSFDASEDWSGENSFPIFRGKDEEKKITPSMFDQLIREDPFAKFVNRQASPSSNFCSQGSGLFPNFPPVTSTPYGMLQSNRDRDSDEVDTESVESSPSSSKRKLSEDGDYLDDKDESGQPRDKRLRTTILPEQLDFLYQKYQVESNPSRKMLEQIANEVGLRKRVVQVWFQNTRARERKGQFRAHQQVINKRCPYCPALFKVRSALESHLATKHSDQYTRGEINIDALPDAEGGAPCIDEGDSRSILGQPLTPTSSVSGGGPIGGCGSDLELSMRKYYEDTMKRYMNDLQGTSSNVMKRNSPPLPPPPPSSSQSENPEKSLPSNQALDLTGPALDLSSKSENADSWDESSENNNQLDGGNSYDFDGDESSALEGSGQNYRNNNSGDSSSSKRFRTQMSSLQIKMMKSVFSFYKTPTMTECSELGRQIGLQKRVVQVWFQNARAKEKKAKLQLQQATGVDPEMPPTPEECSLCDFKFSQQIVLQDHLFSKSHQDSVRMAIAQGRYDPESPGHALTQALMSVTDEKPNEESEASSQANNASRLSPISPSINNEPSGPPPPPPGQNREDMEKTLMQQLYGVGHGISSYPTGVATANPFLHPAMFSATGK